MIKNKNEKGKELFELLGGLDEDIVEDAWNEKGGKIMLNKRGYIGKTVIAAAAVCAVAVGAFGAVKLNFLRSATSEPGVVLSHSASSQPGVVLSPADSVKPRYDVIALQSITSAKSYKVEFLQPTEEDLIALFKGEPTRSVDPKFKDHVDFTVGDETGWMNKTPDRGHHTVLYWTEQGDKYDSAAYYNYAYEEADAHKDWDFLSRADAKKKISEILSPFMPSGVSVNVYAISREYYTEYAEEHAHGIDKFGDDVQNDWGTPADYYYFVAEQTVDGIPIKRLYGIGDSNGVNATIGGEATGVLSADGLGFLRVHIPYEVTEGVETSEKFVRFLDAEKKFKEMADLSEDDIALNNARLVYIVVPDGYNGMMLTPAWEFEYNDHELFFVNAYTGEEMDVT